MAQMRVRRVFSFPLDDHLREGLEAIREETGVPVAYQIRRGIVLWLESQGRLGKTGVKRKDAARPATGAATQAGRKRAGTRKRP